MADCNLPLIVASGMLLKFNRQRFLWSCLRNLFECRYRHPATPRRRWFILSYWHLFIPYAFNISIVCPSLMVTIAFFHSRGSTGRGAAPRRRIHLGLPGIRITFTLTTSTLKRLSTARRISILLAFNATLKVYWLRSCNLTDFSVTIPWRSISVSSTCFLLAYASSLESIDSGSSSAVSCFNLD